jgi:hypothetical protein
MRSLLSTLTLGLLWVQWVTALDELLTKSWTLSHSFHGGPDATIRGKITLSIANGVVDLQLDTDEHCLSRNAVETLWESGWYQLQLREDGDSQAPVIRTSVPACQLVRANFRYVSLQQSLFLFHCRTVVAHTTLAQHNDSS